MINFMFDILGSKIFWISYFLFGFVIGNKSLRYIAPLSWETIKTGRRPDSKKYSFSKVNKSGIYLVIICIYIFWPYIFLFNIYMLFNKYCFSISKKNIWLIYRKIVIFVDYYF